MNAIKVLQRKKEESLRSSDRINERIERLELSKVKKLAAVAQLREELISNAYEDVFRANRRKIKFDAIFDYIAEKLESLFSSVANHYDNKAKNALAKTDELRSFELN